MAAVARLVTLVDIRDDSTEDPRTSAAPYPSQAVRRTGWAAVDRPPTRNVGVRQMSVSARHEALLVDGRRVLLLDDRGWSSSGNVPDIWAVTSVEDIEETARFVVGPDEPFAGRSQEDMEAAHWAFLSEVLRRQGVVVDARELKRLPHDVVLSERLLARVARDDLSP
jgi:hypothetical protein